MMRTQKHRERSFIVAMMGALVLTVVGLFYTTVNAAPLLQAPTSPKINEFVVDHVGVDNYEYVEIVGDANVDYSRYTVLAVEGTITTSYGVVNDAFVMGMTNAQGFYDTGYMASAIEGDTITLLLVRNFSGGIGTDLDLNDDGVIDNPLWDSLVDDVAVTTGAVNDIAYSTTMLMVGGASRIPDGADTDTAVDWTENDFDGAGIPGLDPGTPVVGEAFNTPGASNELVTLLPNLMINEFVFDHVGADLYEYLEVFGDPSTDYSAFTILAVEGYDPASLGVISETFTMGTTDANGFYVTNYMAGVLDHRTVTLLLVENFTGTVGSDVDTNDDGTIDTVYWSNILDDVAVTDGGSGGADETILMYSAVTLPPSFDGGSTTVGGASRIPNGMDTDTRADWTRNDFDGAGIPGLDPGTPSASEANNTPGAENVMGSVTPPGTIPMINEFVLDHVGADNYEYVEISGDPSTDYSRYTLLAIEGDITVTVGITPSQGVIDNAIAMGTTNAAGYFFTGYLANAFTSDTVTLLLVDGFTGTLGNDTDTNNDGVIDSTFWSAIVDDVAVTNGNASNVVYSTVVLSPSFDGGSTTPGGASRLPDSIDTDTASDWTRNDFDGAGIPGLDPGTSSSTEANNTPEAVNMLGTDPVPPAPVINEFVIDHVGTDNYEFIELFGDPSTDYSAFTILAIEGDNAENRGTIDGVFPMGTTDANGFYDTGYMTNMLENGATTFLLVESFSGALGNDIDTDNNGVIDTTYWTQIVDDVAARNQYYGSVVYSTVVLDAVIIAPSIVMFSGSRIPNGIDTNTTADWMRNDYDGAGIPALDPGTPVDGEAQNTRGITNTEVTPLLINEFVLNHVGTDNYEYIEVLGLPNVDYSSVSLLAIEGDSGESPGAIDAVFSMGTTDANGYWDTGFLTDALENGTVTLLMVQSFTGAVGNDIDANDDGTIDTPLWTAVLDDVAVNDGGVNDLVYSTTSLTAAFDGGASAPGGASRIPNGTDTNTIADWMRNDFDGAGIPALDPGTPETGEANNTRGAVNTTAVASLPAPLINEFVFDHVGADTYEFLEIAGNANGDYSRYTLLAIEGAITPTVGITPSQGVISNIFGIGTTNADGIYVTDYMNDVMAFDTVTLLLVDNFTGAIGDDIDTNNDGVIDATFWTSIVDDVAVTNGNPSNIAYSTVVLSPGFDGDPIMPGGASRIPNATDTDAVSDWMRNDFDGFGLPGLVGTPSTTEANNTPGAVNTTNTDLVWLGYTDNWQTPTNWATGAVPTIGDSVTIPTTPIGGQMPKLYANAAVLDLMISADASLDLSTYTLTVENGLTNMGTISQIKPATAVNTPVEFIHILNNAGTVDQYFGVVITPTSVSMGNVTVSIKGQQPFCAGETDPLLTRCFEVVPTSVQPATIKLYYESSEQNGQAANALKLWLYESQPWLDASSTHVYRYSETGTTCAAAYCWFEAESVNTYAPFTGGIYSIFTWLGYTDNWQTPTNWSIGIVPTLNDSIIIPANPIGGQMPKLYANAAVHDLTIEYLASLDLSTYTITVESGLSNFGTMSQTKPVTAVSSPVEFMHIVNDAGTTDQYLGVIITPQSASMGDVTVSIKGRQACTTNPADPLLWRCYTITPTSAQAATIRLFYEYTYERHGQTWNALILWHYDGPPGQWSNASDTNTYSRGNYNGVFYWFEAADVTTYSPFTGGSGAAPTAVTLHSLHESTPASILPLIVLTLLLLMTLVFVKNRNLFRKVPLAK